MSSRSLEAWKDMTLSSYCRKHFMIQQQTQEPPRSLMNSIPPFWAIELTRNGVLEDTFDSTESLFCALPPIDDPSAPPSIANGCYDAEDRDLVRRLISDYDFFFNSERGSKAFHKLILKQRLFPQEFLKKPKRENTNDDQSANNSNSVAVVSITNPVRDHVFVGKSESALIKLDNPSVSRIHCVIFLGVENEVKVNKQTNREESQPVCGCYVVDLASSNGTFLTLPKTSAVSQQQQADQIVKLSAGIPTKLPDGASIRCGTSSVAITVQCTSWADRLLRQKDDDENRRQQMTAFQQEQQQQPQQQQQSGMSNVGNRIRQRENDNEGNQKNIEDDFIVNNNKNSSDDASITKILNLRKLSLDTIRMRQQQIRMEIATRSANNNNNNSNSGIALLQNELRDVEFVLNEKIQEQISRVQANDNNRNANHSSKQTIVEIVEQNY